MCGRQRGQSPACLQWSLMDEMCVTPGGMLMDINLLLGRKPHSVTYLWPEVLGCPLWVGTGMHTIKRLTRNLTD